MATTTATVTSFFSNGASVTVDPYGPNPLVDEVRVGNPTLFKMATASDGAPPKMFAAGTEDWPAFTASGVDPSLLMQFPYRCRHYVAALSDRAEVYALAEEYANDPTSEFGSPGLTSAVVRVRNWLSGRVPTMQEQVAALASNQRQQQSASKAAIAAMSDEEFGAMFDRSRLQGK